LRGGGKRRCKRRAIVCEAASTRDRGDLARGKVELPNPGIVGVSYEQVSAAVYGNSRRLVERGFLCRAVITAGAGNTVAGNRRDDVCDMVHFADAVVERVGDEEIPASIDRNCIRGAERCSLGQPVVAQVARPATCDRGDDTS